MPYPTREEIAALRTQVHANASTARLICSTTMMGELLDAAEDRLVLEQEAFALRAQVALAQEWNAFLEKELVEYHKQELQDLKLDWPEGESGE